MSEVFLSPAAWRKGDIVITRVVRLAVRPSVCPSVIIFFSGAELENHSVYFIETWQIYQSHTEVVPFAILGFLTFLFFTFPWQQV